MSGIHSPASSCPSSSYPATPARRLPHGLHEEASHLTAESFVDVYSPSGPLQVDDWSVQSAPQDLIRFSASLAVAGRTHDCESQAAGLIGAMTAVLHDLGIALEISRLHQRDSDGRVVIFLLCRADDRERWAFGAGSDGDEASVNALVAGANRLYQAA